MKKRWLMLTVLVCLLMAIPVVLGACGGSGGGDDAVGVVGDHRVDPGRDVVVAVRALERRPVGLGHAVHVGDRRAREGRR